MDPVTAVGLASGILTFISFSSALIKVGHGVCATSNGRNEQTLTREVVMNDTRAFLSTLLPVDDARLAHEADLRLLVDESRRIAQDLLNILEKVKPRQTGSLANLRSAIKHVVSQPDVSDLERRLDQCRSQLDLQLNSRYFKHMKSSLDQALAQGELGISKLSQLQSNVEHLCKGVVVDSLSEEAQEQFRRLIGVQQESLDRTCQDAILHALQFADMRSRYDGLHPAHSQTFRWLLPDLQGEQPSDARQSKANNLKPAGDRLDQSKSANDSDVAAMRASARHKFLDWLASPDPVFHVCGKLGSGKSTLMKYLFEHWKTRAELEAWAGQGKHLVMAGFFFWKPGSELQRSFPGLCRSLLHDILEARPTLIRMVLPDVWAQATRRRVHAQSPLTITHSEIRNALEILLCNEQVYEQHRFCLFIDGLDEYEGAAGHDYRAMVDTITSWARNSQGGLKLCVSSREYNVFMNAFCENRRFRIHQLTLPDIRSYVQDRLGHLPDIETQRKLVRGIAEKADGIFFWATLVVKSMRDGIEDGTSDEDLVDLLDSLPKEIEGLFDYILTNLDDKKRERTHQTVAMLRTYKSPQRGDAYYPPLTLLAYSFMDNYIKDPRFSVRECFSVEASPATEEKREQLATKHLRANCRGLIEVRRFKLGDMRRHVSVIDYTHRSVPEYFEETRRGRNAGLFTSFQPFDAGDAVSSLLLAHYRFGGSMCWKSVDFAGLAKYRLAEIATPDQEPFEFLELLDSLADLAGYSIPIKPQKIHIRASGPGRHASLLGCLYSFHDVKDALIDDRASDSFGDSNGHGGDGKNNNNSTEKVEVHRSIYVAISNGFDDYSIWKLKHDRSLVDTSIKRAILSEAATHRTQTQPLWDALFASGAFHTRETCGFVMDIPIEVSSGLFNVNPAVRWDTTRCAWFSAWRQFLVRETRQLLMLVPLNDTKDQQKEHSKYLGGIVEQFLRHGASDEEFVVTLGTCIQPAAHESGRSLRIVKLTYQFGKDSELCLSRVEGEMLSVNDEKIFEWFRSAGHASVQPGEDISITLRDIIQATRPPNQETLLSLLDGSPFTANEMLAPGAALVGENTETAEPPMLPPSLLPTGNTTTTETRWKWGQLDRNHVLAFVSGVLVSMFAMLWGRYAAASKFRVEGGQIFANRAGTAQQS